MDFFCYFIIVDFLFVEIFFLLALFIKIILIECKSNNNIDNEISLNKINIKILFYFYRHPTTRTSAKSVNPVTPFINVSVSSILINKFIINKC